MNKIRKKSDKIPICTYRYRQKYNIFNITNKKLLASDKDWSDSTPIIINIYCKQATVQFIILFSNTIGIPTENITTVMTNYSGCQNCRSWKVITITQRKRGVIRRESLSQRERSRGEGRKGGITGGRERFLWCVVPWGQRGGEGLLPWQIWRCPVLLFLRSPSSCRKQHHAGHQSIGKLWLFRSGTDVCCLQMRWNNNGQIYRWATSQM